MDSGYLQSSRFGFRGSEDLGGGLRAIFTLESGYNIDNGANSSAIFFNRQSFVGLSSSNLGTLTLGRQYTPIYDNLILLSGAPAFGVSGGAVRRDRRPAPGLAARAIVEADRAHQQLRLVGRPPEPAVQRGERVDGGQVVADVAEQRLVDGAGLGGLAEVGVQHLGELTR